MLSQTIIFVVLAITICIVIGLIIYFYNKKSCVPNCLNKKCGDDGCGGSCGSCEKGKKCDNGTCISSTCNPSCENKKCGDDGCGGSCGICKDGENCLNGKCIKSLSSCVPQCTDKECGNNGCGGQCGSCGDGKICMKGKCIVSPCAGYCGTGPNKCGDDGCGRSCGTCDKGNYCLLPSATTLLVNGTCTKSNCKSNEIDVQNTKFDNKCCDTNDNNYFNSNLGGYMVDSCCPKKYNCTNGCSPDGWYKDDESNMFCNIASQTLTKSWPKNPRLCGLYGQVYYPNCPITNMWAQSRENLSCEQIVADNQMHVGYIESNGFKWNPEHSRCEPVDVRDNITVGVYPQLLDCLKENNNHNGICTDAISNCDSCNGNIYNSCFCAPIIKAPIYFEYDKDTGETMNLPVITNQVKNDLYSPLQTSIVPAEPGTKIPDKITSFDLILEIPIGLWVNLNNSYVQRGIMTIDRSKLCKNGDFTACESIGLNDVFDEYPAFRYSLILSETTDIKLDIGYYKNIQLDKMTLNKTEFSLIIKVIEGVINIYLNNNNKPTILISMEQHGMGYIRSPDYTILNTSYRLGDYYSGEHMTLEMVLALPNKIFSSSVSSYYIPTKQVTKVDRIKNNANKINKKVKNVRSTNKPGLFTIGGNSSIILDPTNYPAII